MNPSSPSQAAEPKLDRPGAGLPWYERAVAWWMIMRAPKSMPWDAVLPSFRRQTERIVAQVKDVEHSLLQTKVLIPRVRGIEDSSRNWSISMTLEHLILVGEGMAEIVVQLSRGQTPPVEVDIAKVKPRGSLDPGRMLEEFQTAMIGIEKRLLNEVQDRQSMHRHVHPWFGGLTAHQWAVLLSSHQAIHRKQIELIVQGLRFAKSAP